jgi:transposase InsO family protein
MVKSQRKVMHRLGTRKLHHIIKDELASLQLKCGRDKLFGYLRNNGMLITPKRRYVQTTNSKHWLYKYPNLIKDKPITRPDQVWVTDITYIKTEQGNCYINMITDAYSKKIVGYAFADNMETKSMIEAYRMALKEKKDTRLQTIHHSDRGLQYCSKDYINLSIENNCLISMTENGDPYENALAERMNRTIKEEFGLGEILKTKEHGKQLIKEAVYVYNNYRPHLSLNYNTPNEMHKKIPDNFLDYQGLNQYL